MRDEPGSSDPERGRAQDRTAGYWRSNVRVMLPLLAVWWFVSFGLGIVWVDPLNRLLVGGFPLGFWFAQQGAIYVFILLIFAYAFWMDRVDRKHGVDGDP